MYEASIESWGETRSVASTRTGSFVVDTQGRAANPVDTVLVGLCACLGHYVRDFLVKQGVPAPRFRVSAQASAAADRPGLGSISVRIELLELELGAERERALVEHAEQCIVHATLRRACPVEIAVAPPRAAA